MLVKCKKFLNDIQIKSLYNLVDILPPTDGKLTAGEIYKDRKSNTQYFDREGGPRSIERAVFNKINEDIVRKKITCGEFRNLASLISVYNKGDFYDWHLDQIFSGDGRTVKIHYTIWLNDPEEYEGGEFRIKHAYGEEEIKPEKGFAVFYPAGFIHKVEEVTKGKRVVVVGGLDTLVGSPHDRYVITELSQSIEKIYNLLDSFEEDDPDDVIRTLEEVHSSLCFVEDDLIRRGSKV